MYREDTVKPENIGRDLICHFGDRTVFGTTKFGDQATENMKQDY